MQMAIQRELRLAKLPEPADVADALAIALCHYYLAVRRNNATAAPKLRAER
jgi:crossover junction endodeoxyribonuclease RuvC